MSEPTRPDLVMPRDEFEMARWLFQVTGGPAFPANAATACRIVAKQDFCGFGDVFARLAEALDRASPSTPESPRRAGGDLGDREARAEAAEAKVAALEAALRKHMPVLDERGTPVCGGCLEPVPCPDAGLLGGEDAPAPSGMQDPAPVARVITEETQP